MLSGGLSKSTDGGRTLDRIANNVHGDHQSFWIDPMDSDRLISGSDGGWQISLDAGANFDVQKNIVLSQFYQVFVDDRDPYYVLRRLARQRQLVRPEQLHTGRHPDGSLVHGLGWRWLLRGAGPG